MAEKSDNNDDDEEDDKANSEYKLTKLSVTLKAPF